MSTASDDLSLPEFLQELRRLYGDAPSYQSLWAAVAGGRVPARQVKGRYRLERAVLPPAARMFGLVRPNAA
jgi:hypothetical protein